MHPVIEIKNLRINFKTEGEVVPALRGVNLSVNRNEIVGIAGESGSGKSVTSLALLRLLPPAAEYAGGEILFSPDGKERINILEKNDQELRTLRGNQIAMIFQEPMSSLNPVFTCGEQVAEAIRQHALVDATEAKVKTIQLFRKVKLPDPAAMYDRYPHQLSGGQKQRVMIAMAISGNPALLICDEPTTALDVTVQKAVLDLIRELQAETGMSVLFITHDLGVLAEIADRIVIMYRGEVKETGPTAQILASPTNNYTRALLACRPGLYPKGTRLPVVDDFMNEAGPDVSTRSAAGDAGMAPRDSENNQHHEDSRDPLKVPPAAVGPLIAVQHHEKSRDPLKVPPAAAGPLIAVQHLTVRFPAKRSFLGKTVSHITAVDDVSFDVFRGETLGLVGESGSGKTTLGRTLLRLIEPAAGRILYNGTDIGSLQGSALRQMRPKMQIIFQDPYSSLNPSATIGNLISEPLAVHFPKLTPSERRQKVMTLLEKVGLNTTFFNRYPHEFSGGQRQRIVIARALALEPEFIICDESVSALDVSVQAQVLNLLNDLKSEFSFTSIFISHDLAVIRYVSDRIMVMNKGRIEEIGPAEQVWSNPSSDYTRMLLKSVPKLPLNQNS